MIINRLAATQNMPESNWKKALRPEGEARKKERNSRLASAGAGALAGAAGGPVGMAGGAILGLLIRENLSAKVIEPSNEERNYIVKWQWNQKNQDLIRGYCKKITTQKGIWSAPKNGKSRADRVKKQNAYLVSDNMGYSIGEDGIEVISIGDLGVCYLSSNGSGALKVFVPWDYFVNRPIFVGPALSVLEEHEMPEKFEVPEGSGCYVGDYMVFHNGQERVREVTMRLRELQRLLRSSCTVRE